ncbi:MAG: hypothetical protein FGM15_06030 [Chthoniobacterales bacterium]|nr:hypothetical protein [Chthoniobacterales bacterium]
MRVFRANCVLPAFLLAGTLLCGCSLRQPAVLTDNFAFDIPAPAPGMRGGRTISVLPFSAAPQAAGQMFLYRADESRYERDYYNRFLAPPAQMLGGQLRKWLMLSRAGEVLQPGGPLAADLVVQPRLVSLYADYRDTSKPRAVVAVVMVLVDRGSDGDRQLFENIYRREIPMREVSPAAAAEGWSKGFAEIFAQFTRDLRAAG